VCARELIASFALQFCTRHPLNKGSLSYKYKLQQWYNSSKPLQICIKKKYSTNLSSGTTQANLYKFKKKILSNLSSGTTQAILYKSHPHLSVHVHAKSLYTLSTPTPVRTVNAIV
jgi:hypothetical protein